jgi:hypothetical protein
MGAEAPESEDPDYTKIDLNEDGGTDIWGTSDDENPTYIEAYTGAINGYLSDNAAYSKSGDTATMSVESADPTDLVNSLIDVTADYYDEIVGLAEEDGITYGEGDEGSVDWEEYRSTLLQDISDWDLKLNLSSAITRSSGSYTQVIEVSFDTKEGTLVTVGINYSINKDANVSIKVPTEYNDGLENGFGLTTGTDDSSYYDDTFYTDDDDIWSDDYYWSDDEDSVYWDDDTIEEAEGMMDDDDTFIVPSTEGIELGTIEKDGFEFVYIANAEDVDNGYYNTSISADSYSTYSYSTYYYSGNNDYVSIDDTYTTFPEGTKIWDYYYKDKDELLEYELDNMIDLYAGGETGGTSTEANEYDGWTYRIATYSYDDGEVYNMFVAVWVSDDENTFRVITADIDSNDTDTLGFLLNTISN